MTLKRLKESLSESGPPEQMGELIQAMWWDAKGDWRRSHEIAQDVDSEDGSWVHAYLHRKEGDHGNASYWYRRANRSMFDGSLEEEWESIVTELLLRE